MTTIRLILNVPDLPDAVTVEVLVEHRAEGVFVSDLHSPRRSRRIR